jgi:tetratricopeptide (TPR) repeat protein
VHLIFSRNAPERALWLIEGMAEVYSTWKAVGSVLQVGRPLEGHLYLLGRQGLIPLAQFLAVGPNSPYYNEQNKQGIFYAQAWALTHYLLIDNYPEGLARLRAYLAALADKKEPLAAFRQAFGPLPQVEKALKEYVARQKFKYFPFQLASTEAEERAEVSSPSPAEVQCRLGDFLLQSGRLDEAATTLSHAVQLDGGLAPARLALARAHLERHEIAEAKEEVRKALELSPRNAEAHYLRAETLLRAAGDGPVVLAWDTIAEAVNELTTALAIAPEMEKARALLESLPKAPALAAETPSSTRSAPAAAEPQSAPAPPQSETAPEDAPELAEAHRQVRRGDFTRAMEALARAEQTDGSLAIRQQAQIERERLQELSAGTVQVEGTLVLLRCRPDTSLTFVVQAGTRMMTLHAPTPRSVMLYGPDGEREKRGFACGPQKATVLARYVPGVPEGAPAADGTLLALYFR